MLLTVVPENPNLFRDIPLPHVCSNLFRNIPLPHVCSNLFRDIPLPHVCSNYQLTNSQITKMKMKA